MARQPIYGNWVRIVVLSWLWERPILQRTVVISPLGNTHIYGFLLRRSLVIRIERKGEYRRECVTLALAVSRECQNKEYQRCTNTHRFQYCFYETSTAHLTGFSETEPCFSFMRFIGFSLLVYRLSW